MSIENDNSIPDALKRPFRMSLLHQIQGTSTLDIHELEFFDWYVKETETLLVNMLSSERAFIQEQVQVGAEDINDSGMVAVNYYLKRVRYSHVIYMASLLETLLERSCVTLTTVIGDQNLPFAVTELKGDNWTVKRKFLERYGKFSVPDNLRSEIQALITLRNNLVHDNGSTCDMKDDERKILAKCSGINLDGYEVAIEDDYIRSALESIKSMVRFIEGQIGAVVDRAIHPKPVT